MEPMIVVVVMISGAGRKEYLVSRPRDWTRTVEDLAAKEKQESDQTMCNHEMIDGNTQLPLKRNSPSSIASPPPSRLSARSPDLHPSQSWLRLFIAVQQRLEATNTAHA